MATAPLYDDDELMGVAAEGGTVNRGGQVINAGGAWLGRARPEAAPARTAQPPVVHGLGAKEVEALMDAREAAWREHSDSLQRQVDLLAAMVQTLQARKPPTWRLTQLTDPDTGAIVEIVATPS